MNYAVKETGIFRGAPRFMSSPRVQYSAVSFGESMVAIQPDLSPGPLLASEWDISDDGQFWTFKVRDDVEFHHKCGESGDQSCGTLNIHDILWNYKEWHEGSLNARAGIIGDFWVGNEGRLPDGDRRLHRGDRHRRALAPGARFRVHAPPGRRQHHHRQHAADPGEGIRSRRRQHGRHLPRTRTAEYEATRKSAKGGQQEHLRHRPVGKIDLPRQRQRLALQGRGRPLAADPLLRSNSI